MLSSLRRRIAAFISPDLADEAAGFKAAMEDLAKYEEEGTYADGYEEGNSDLKRANAETFEEVINWLKRKGRTFDDQITARDIVEELDHVFSTSVEKARTSAADKAVVLASLRDTTPRDVTDDALNDMANAIVTSLLKSAKAEPEKLGRFGHHPDPADDFILEVQEIEQEWGHHKIGFENGTPSIEELRKRVSRAMDSGPFITEACQMAKDALRQVEREMAASASLTVEASAE